MPVTRRNPSGDYGMDRIYASCDVTVVGAAVVYGDGSNVPRHSVLTSPPDGIRVAPGSDHAYVWAELEAPLVAETELGNRLAGTNGTRSHERLMKT